MKQHEISLKDSNTMRGVAILFIVLHNLIHCIHPVVENEFSFCGKLANQFFQALFDGDGSFLMDIFSFLGWYGVPVFLFLSGYGLVKKYETNETSHISFAHFAKYHFVKLFKLLVIPYALFVFVEMVLYKGAISIESILYHLTFTINLWPDEITPGVYWFFGLIMQLYLCYYVFCYRKTSRSILAVNLLSLLALVGCLAADNQAGMYFIRHQCIGWILPFTLGVVYARYNISILFKETWKNACMFALGVALLLLFSLNAYLWLLTPVIAIALAIYLNEGLQKVRFLNRPFLLLGEFSAYLFVVHAIVRRFYGDFVTGSTTVSILLYLLFSVVLAMVCRWLFQAFFEPKKEQKPLRQTVVFAAMATACRWVEEKIKQVKKETWIDLAKTYGFFLLFALVLYIKSKLFLDLIDANFHHQFAFDRCLSISLFIASFSLIIKNRIWPVVFCFLMDLWMISNMIYYNSCGFFIDIHALKMATNLAGFENSVTALWQNKFLWMFVPTLALGIGVFFLKQSKRYFITWALLAVFCYCFQGYAQYERWRHWVDGDYIPSHVYNPFARGIFNSFKTLIQCTSGLHIFFYDAYDLLHESFEGKPTLTEQELEDINTKVFHADAPAVKTEKLLVVIVESLENWGISAYSTPNLWAMMQEKPNLHCTRIYQQTRQGVSSDGQMLVHSGMLPLKEGVVSMLYPSTDFCSLFDCSEQSTIILPHSDDVWNQNYMNLSYGFKNKWISPNWNDDEIFTQAIQHVEKGVDRISVITLSSHLPFTNYWDTSKNTLDTPSDMPTLMADYLRSLHHTDKLMAALLERYKNDPQFADYTLVITGDHTIFLEPQLNEFANYLQGNPLPIAKPEKCCPLIIFSPKITEDITVTDACYQMDILPTVKSLVGIKYHQYNGFGVNVMDANALQNRPFAPEAALELSDKIIKTNYLKEKKKELDNK